MIYNATPINSLEIKEKINGKKEEKKDKKKNKTKKPPKNAIHIWSFHNV